MKLKYFFADSFMNCIMIVLTMLYSSTILQYQKSETCDEDPTITMVASWLQMKGLLAWIWDVPFWFKILTCNSAHICENLTHISAHV